MTNRVSSIHNINNRYRNSRVSPSHQIYQPAPMPFSTAIPTSTISRSRIRTSNVGLPTVIPAGSRIISGGGNLRGSRIQTITHPPVYQVVTTPGRVYEIVTPIIEVTPDTIAQRGGRYEGNIAKAWVKRDEGGCCKWWCWLLGLLLLLGVLGGLGYLFRDRLFGTGKEGVVVNKEKVEEKKEVKNEVKNEVKTQQVTKPNQPNPTPVITTPQPHKQQPAKQQTDNLALNSTQSSLQKQKQNPKPQQPAKVPTCEQGSFLYQGRCIRCPPLSTWNGSQCIKQVITKRDTVVETTEGENSGEKNKESSEVKSEVKEGEGKVEGKTHYGKWRF